MRARSLALWVAAVVGAFALFATPAEAGGKRYRYYNGGYHNGGYYNGGYYNGGCYRGGYGYYRPYYRGYYRPYYRGYYRGYGYYGGPGLYIAVPPVRIAIGGGYW
jgi:hypothetical protein